jgi:hypothetical protein
MYIVISKYNSFIAKQNYLYAEQVVPLAECSTIEIPGVFRADK